MNGIIELQIWQFALVYLLLLVVLAVMRAAKVEQGRLLMWASIRMTVQLVLAGLILGYLLLHKNPWLTTLVVIVITAFSIHRVLAPNQELNRRFQVIIGASLAVSGLAVLAFFILAVVGANLFDPQYVIPIAGMLFGNAMTGLSLAIKTLRESLRSERDRINALLNVGATPKRILLPYVNQATETAMLPTLNSMLGTGIVFLPGMMTGQILSGVDPMISIMYQIAISLGIATVAGLSVFGSLYFGHRTLYNARNQIMLDE